MRKIFRICSKGFTLAEILITLGIIGVVAALTIPTLMQNTQEKATITALKKAYSVLSQAYASSINENGTPDTWNLQNSTTDFKRILTTYFVPYLQVGKNCINTANCFPSASLLQLNGAAFNSSYSNLYNTYPIFQLSNGDLVALTWVSSPSCNSNFGTSDNLKGVCGLILYDTNGSKSPNTVGIDTFFFWFAKNGIIPTGTADATSYIFDTNCKDPNSTVAQNGLSCTAWIIYNNNMDYLHCSNLAWGSKNKCN